MSTRPLKTWRMSYWNTDSSDAEASISLLGDPGEIRVSVGGKSFLGVKEDSLTLSAGTPAKINVQALSHSFKYGGMIQDLPWPLTMMPSTTYTPFPKQIISPPFLEQLPTIQQVAVIATSMAGF